jgi:hypothetical protein
MRKKSRFKTFTYFEGFAGEGLVFAANLMKGSKIGSHRQPLQFQRSAKGPRAWEGVGLTHPHIL